VVEGIRVRLGRIDSDVRCVGIVRRQREGDCLRAADGDGRAIRRCALDAAGVCVGGCDLIQPGGECACRSTERWRRRDLHPPVVWHPGSGDPPDVGGRGPPNLPLVFEELHRVIVSQS